MCNGFRFFLSNWPDIVVTCLIGVFATVGYMHGLVLSSVSSGHVLRSLGQLPPVTQSASNVVNPRYPRPSATSLSLNKTCHQAAISNHCTTVVIDRKST